MNHQAKKKASRTSAGGNPFRVDAVGWARWRRGCSANLCLPKTFLLTFMYRGLLRRLFLRRRFPKPLLVLDIHIFLARIDLDISGNVIDYVVGPIVVDRKDTKAIHVDFKALARNDGNNAVIQLEEVAFKLADGFGREQNG